MKSFAPHFAPLAKDLDYFRLDSSRLPGLLTQMLETYHLHLIRRIPAGQAERLISTGQLHALPHFHIQPINVVVFNVPSGNSSLEGGFPLRCFQRLSLPDLATRLCCWHNNRNTRGLSIPVLSY